MNVLFSLKPEYANAILSGKKKYEFRRSIFKNPQVKKAFIYVTAPISKIVGGFLIGKIICGTPQEIWKKCKRHSGISKKAFFDYYDGCKKAFAIQIQKVFDFANPLDPYLRKPNFRPPQSFCYVMDEFSPERNIFQRTLGTFFG